MIKAKVAFVLFSVCLLFNYILEVDAQTKRRRTPRVTPAAITTPSGLTYLITKKGMGRQPKKGETIVVHYTGMLTNGVKFDSHMIATSLWPSNWVQEERSRDGMKGSRI